MVRLSVTNCTPDTASFILSPYHGKADPVDVLGYDRVTGSDVHNVVCKTNNLISEPDLI